MKYTHPKTRSSFLISAAMFSSMSAFADNNRPKLEEVVVTSQFREVGLHDVPISVAAIDARTIKDTNLFKIEDLNALVPNLTYSETGISTTFYLRGLGSGINQGFEQSVGVYVDGIGFPRAQQVRTPFLDVEHIEVLRGPQSILFGKNSVAGAISVHSGKPTNSFEGSVLASYETEDGESLFEGVASGPLSDRVRARVAARYRDADGYIDNITLNRSEPQREETALRGTFEFDVKENLLATFKAEFSEFDTVGRNIELNATEPATAGPFAGLSYPQILVNVFGQDASVLNATLDGQRSANADNSFNKTENYQMTFVWKQDNFDLLSVTNYQNLDYNEICDCDFTGADVFLLDIAEEYSQFSQEIRITSPVGNHFDYIAGAYFQSSDHQYSDILSISPTSVLVPLVNAGSAGSGDLLSGTQATRLADVDAQVWSLFAQMNWHITSTTTLQFGGRFTNDRRDGRRAILIERQGGGALPAAQVAAPLVYAGVFQTNSSNLSTLGPAGAGATAILGEGAVEGDLDETSFSPDIKFIWDVNKDILLYTSFSRGNKAGGFDFRANNRGTFATSADAFVFADEEATNYEVGGRFKIGEVAEVNVTAFFTDLEDLQVSVFDGGVGFNVGNAASAEVKGLEVDGRWAVANHLRLGAGLAITDFEFTDYPNGQCYFGRTPDFANGLCDYTGESNVLVSDFTANVSANFDIPFDNGYKFTGLAHVFYVDDYDASTNYNPRGKQDSYSKLNVRLGFSPNDEVWEVALLGKNLTDEKTSNLVGEAPLSGSSFGANATYQFVGQGRTLALQLRVNF